MKKILREMAIVALMFSLTFATVYAAYTFLTIKTEITVEEAIVIGYNWCGYNDGGDDLRPYMVGGTVVPEIIIAVGTGDYDVDVTIAKNDSVDASEFCPGETLIVPLNLRNRADGALTLDVAHGDDGGLDVDFAVVGPDGSTGWFDSVTGFVMPGHAGTFGSDTDCNGTQDDGAYVLYIRIIAPGDCPPGTYTFGLTFSRG